MRRNAAGVLFDLFGTVVVPFSRAGHQGVLASAADALGLDPLHCDMRWDADYYNRVRGRSGGIAEQLSVIAMAQGTAVCRDRLGDVVASYARACDEFMVPMPTALATLRSLAERDVPVGLVSNTAPDFAAAFERSLLRPLFRTCTFSCFVGAAKPEREIYVAASAALGVEPSRLLFVGDGSDDELAGADAAGLTSVLVEIGYDDTYDPNRHAVINWTGLRINKLSGVLQLLA